MKVVLATSGGNVVLEEVPVPAVDAGQVLVETTHSVVSTGTEVASLRSSQQTGSPLRGALTDPGFLVRGLKFVAQSGIKAAVAVATGHAESSAYTLGYSAAGRVVDVAPGVTEFKRGDRVAIAGYGFASHAEYNGVPVNLTVPVPDGVGLREASLATIGAIAMQGIRRASPTIGETVLVVGLGLIGQLAAEIALAAGCRVIGVDLDEARAERLRRRGAALAFAPDDGGFAERAARATGGVGVDAVVICAAGKGSQVANEAMEACRKKGRVVVVGDVGMDLKRPAMYRKEIDFLISCSYGPGRYDPDYEIAGRDYPIGYVRWTENRNLRAFLDLVAAGRVQVADLIAAEEPFAAAPEVYARLMAGGTGAIATVFRYPAADRPDVEPLPGRSIAFAVAPTERGGVVVGLIGAGAYAAAVLAPRFAEHPDVKVAGVVSRKGLSAARLARKLGAGSAGTDAAELLRRSDVGSVVIATRHGSHARFAVEAARAGKSVFVEKPVALSETDLAAVYRACVESSVPWTVGHNRRFSPHAARLREIRDAAPGPVHVVYTVNAPALPAGHWVLDPDDGGGRLVGEGCHFLDLATFLVGAPPVRVHATGIPEGPRPELWQDFSVSVAYRDGSVARVDYAARGSSAYPKERVTLFAGGCVAEIDDFRKTTVFGRGGRSLSTRGVEKGQAQQVAAWIGFLRGRGAYDLPGDEAIVGTLLALRAVESLRTGLPVDVDVDAFRAAALLPPPSPDR
jgi:predicted dehydrogenase